MKEEENIFNRENFFLLISFVLIGLLIAFIAEISVATGNCVNNVPVENCNKPAGDFAVEPNTTSNNILTGCGENNDGDCIYPNISTLSEAIKKCNSSELINKCNRFSYKNNTMKLVSLTGGTINSKGDNLYVRQNGVTYQGTGTKDDYAQTSQEPGYNSSVLSG